MDKGLKEKRLSWKLIKKASQGYFSLILLHFLTEQFDDIDRSFRKYSKVLC